MQKKFLNRSLFFGVLVLVSISCKKSDETLIHGGNFKYTVGPNNEGKEIIFDNTSANELSAFWSFGDGATSKEKAPTHIYAEIGTYHVTMISLGVPGSEPIESIVEQDVTVTLPPIPLCDVKAAADNYVKGGDMESASAWTIQNIDGLLDADIEFGSKVNVPCSDTGGAFRLVDLEPYSNNGNVMYQSLGNLPVGKYRFSADVNVQTGEDADGKSTNPDRARWYFLEISVSTKTPEVGDGFNEPVIAGFNAWWGDNATVNNAIPAGKGSFPVISAPFEDPAGYVGNNRGDFEITEAGDYNLVIKFGTYQNGDTPGSYGKGGITLDNLAIVKRPD